MRISRRSKNIRKEKLKRGKRKGRENSLSEGMDKRANNQGAEAFLSMMETYNLKMAPRGLQYNRTTNRFFNPKKLNHIKYTQVIQAKIDQEKRNAEKADQIINSTDNIYNLLKKRKLEGLSDNQKTYINFELLTTLTTNILHRIPGELSDKIGIVQIGEKVYTCFAYLNELNEFKLSVQIYYDLRKNEHFDVKYEGIEDKLLGLLYLKGNEESISAAFQTNLTKFILYKIEINRWKWIIKSRVHIIPRPRSISRNKFRILLNGYLPKAYAQLIATFGYPESRNVALRRGLFVWAMDILERLICMWCSAQHHFIVSCLEQGMIVTLYLQGEDLLLSSNLFKFLYPSRPISIQASPSFYIHRNLWAINIYLAFSNESICYIKYERNLDNEIFSSPEWLIKGSSLRFNSSFSFIHDEASKMLIFKKPESIGIYNLVTKKKSIKNTESGQSFMINSKLKLLPFQYVFQQKDPDYKNIINLTLHEFEDDKKFNFKIR